MIREKRYEWKNWKQVLHTTWNPKGPGVIRIHMIPPKFKLFGYAPAVVILNGQDVLPIGESWAILLSEFIRGVNDHGEGEMTEEEFQAVLNGVFHRVREVYPGVSNERFADDLDRIIDTFEAVIHGQVPKEDIGLLSLGEYAPNMTAPHRMDLMVSAMEKDGKWHCNQKCLHCYAADQELSNTKELSSQEWIDIIDKLRAAKVPQLTFTGGEPTLRDDLCELIYAARWFVTRLNTNGILLTPELCAKLVQAELDSVQITFYSQDKAVHNQLVGGSDSHYDKTVSGIKNAIAAGLNMSVNTPLCSLNQDYVKTLQFLHELGVQYVTCSGLIVTGNATKDASKETQLTKDELCKLLKDATEYCYANGMEINFTSPGWIEAEVLKEMGLDVPSCGACLSNMAITPDGKVIPCQSWLSDEALGDMKIDAWKDIWNHPVCRQHREYSAKMTMQCPLKERGGAVHE